MYRFLANLPSAPTLQGLRIDVDAKNTEMDWSQVDTLLSQSAQFPVFRRLLIVPPKTCIDGTQSLHEWLAKRLPSLSKSNRLEVRNGLPIDDEFSDE